MPRFTLSLLISVGLLLSAQQAWSTETDPVTGAAAPTTVQAPVSASGTAAPTAVSAPAAQASAAPAVSTVSTPAAATAPAQTASSTPATAPAAATASAPVSTAAASTAPASAPTAAPAETPAPAATPVYNGSVQVPVRGMDMANVEHIFGAPLEKQPAVGKPPITRWDYSDYVVYFEYNKVLRTVMKSGPFADSQASGG
ncbi:MAG TPA: hypothetical protein VGO35_12510 [Gammaproteobacteria bacterium]|nr:hypothetical protein [Gammaproteobacteria bacterium]